MLFVRVRPDLRCVALLTWLLLFIPSARAHVGTASVFVQGKAGPYPVYVTVTPPAVIPGEAMVSVICDAPDVQSVSVQSNVLAGESARNMPEGQPLERGPAGSHEFHGTTWIMTQGSWQVRVQVTGTRGSGALAVPLPASPTRVMRMSRPFGALLLVLGALLIAGLAALAAAAVREAQEEPGAEPTPAQSRLGRRAAVIALLGCVAVLLAGNHLWRQEIARYSGNIYHPLAMKATVGGDGVLHLRLGSGSAVEQVLSTRPLNDLVLDHNHLMHLYLVRWPAMDVVYHLHPEQVAAGDFDLALPSVPEGTYHFFADIVHADGFPETAVAEMHLDASNGRPLTGDDARGDLPPVSSRIENSILPDGFRYRFAADLPQHGVDTSKLRANVPVVLRFTLLNPSGQTPEDMANYMGMLGHVAVIKDDGSVFAHIHPDGSATMAAYMMANAAASNDGATMPRMSMADGSTEAKLPNVAAFPFGFPSAGNYRLIVQMKHGATVETGATDVVVY